MCVYAIQAGTLSRSQLPLPSRPQIQGQVGTLPPISAMTRRTTARITNCHVIR